MAMYHCRAAKEDSELGRHWIDNYPNGICIVNGVVFIRYRNAWLARLIHSSEYWYARISTTLFPLSDEYYEVA